MAEDKKISALDVLAGENITRADDLMVIVDTSATKTMQITVEEFVEAINKPRLEDSLGDHEFTGVYIERQVNGNYGVGAAVYWNDAATDGFEECDADAAATMPCIGLTLEASAAGSQKVLVWGVLKSSNLSFGTIGGEVFVSGTAGDLTQTAPAGNGDQVQVVGIAITSTELLFAPSLTVVEVAA